MKKNLLTPNNHVISTLYIGSAWKSPNHPSVTGGLWGWRHLRLIHFSISDMDSDINVLEDDRCKKLEWFSRVLLKETQLDYFSKMLKTYTAKKGQLIFRPGFVWEMDIWKGLWKQSRSQKQTSYRERCQNSSSEGEAWILKMFNGCCLLLG